MSLTNASTISIQELCVVDLIASHTQCETCLELSGILLSLKKVTPFWTFLDLSSLPRPKPTLRRQRAWPAHGELSSCEEVVFRAI